MNPTEDVYPLDDQDIELIAAINREGASLQGQLIGVLRSFVKRHNLPGVWSIAENGREIRRVQSAVPAPRENE